MQEYKNTLISKAENLIVHGFPSKIVELNNLLATEQFAERNFAEVHQDLNINIPDPIIDGEANSKEEDGDPPAKRARIEASDTIGTKVMILPGGSVKCNAPICDIIKVVKPVIRKYIYCPNCLIR